MSFLDGPKSRFASIAPIISAGISAHRSEAKPAGCVQCGRLLEESAFAKPNFSGRCDGCDVWVSEEEGDFGIEGLTEF